MDAIYNSIGDNYDYTRKADPEILDTLVKLLEIKDGNKYVDIACGTGNYTVEIAKAGGNWSAFDNSATMLAEARQKISAIDWFQFDIEFTGFEDDTFSGAICTLAIHHFKDLIAAFKEISRILKPDAKLIIFTSTPEQMSNYWLNRYFPQMMLKSCLQMPTLETVEKSAHESQLKITATQKFHITPKLQDFFLYSGKHNPDIYLSEKVRNGISSFRNFCPPEELASGLSQLELDIKTHKFSSTRSNQNPIGDYLYVVLEKHRDIKL